VGKTIRVNRYELTVAGIAPEEFRGTMPGMRMEIWIPMSMAPLLNGQGGWLLEDRTVRQMWVTARLKPAWGSSRRTRKSKRVRGVWRRNRLGPAAASARV